MPGERARTALAATRFADLRWVTETGSTNVDVLDLARRGAPEGLVLVADHQTAGRGRQGRSWTAPPGASLLLTVLLRPPAAAASLTTTALGVAAAEAVEVVAGFTPRLKWPNDLVHPGDGTADDRKLAGILAEADWSDARGGRAVAVAAGIGLNVNWPTNPPAEVADIAIACNALAGREVDREDLLVALLRALDRWYTVAVDDARPLIAEWRTRSATLGRRVRVDLGGGTTVEGDALDVTDEGHLVVRADAGTEHTIAAGDVVHLRPA